MYECVRLDPNQQPDAFTQSAIALLPNNLQDVLKEKSKHTQPILIAARDNGSLAGILLAAYNVTLRFAKVEYLFVLENHRNKHVGRKLLATFENEVNPSTILEIIYPGNEPQSPAIEKILKANQWSEGRPHVIRCFFHPATFSAPWINIKSRYPKDCKEFKWKELREKDKKSIDLIAKQGHFPPYLSPFRDEKLIDLNYSLGLRKNGNVVGWVITHKEDPNTTRFAALYIEHHLRHTGAAIYLLASAIRRLIAMPTPVAVMDVSLSQTGSSWIKLVEKRLIPYATKVVKLKQAWKKAAKMPSTP